MLIQKENGNFNKLAVIFQFDQRVRMDQNLNRVKSGSNIAQTLRQRSHGTSASVLEDIEVKNNQEIVDLCNKNPFYRSKIVHALDSLRQKVKPSDSTKLVVDTKINGSSFRHQKSTQRNNNPQKIKELLRELNLQKNG